MSHMIPPFLIPDAFQRKPLRPGANEAVEWDEEKTKWQPRLVLKADTYSPYRPWKVKPSGILESCHDVMKPGTCVESPQGNFRYCESILPAHSWLSCVQGGKVGKVCFDDDVHIPKVVEKRTETQAGYAESRWRKSPWMSITPQEVFSQRQGIRRAKGDVVIAGLGMGWLLQKVAMKKSVKSLHVIDISQELIDWVRPSLPAHVFEKSISFECGDACEIAPGLTADVLLVDIDKTYGGNVFPHCPKIGFTWVWGSSELQREVWY